MEPEILFEDEEVLAINKPAGMVVNRAQSAKEPTVQDWVESYLKTEDRRRKTDGEDGRQKADIDFIKRSGVVHRLDKETSGVLLIAKTVEAFRELQRQFKDREVEKTYIALVHGKVEPQEGVIRAPVGRLPWNRERFGVLAGGREAETGYRVIKVVEGTKDIKGSFSLVEWYPKTGRTHQIRVHAKSINHPIVADSFYAGRKTAKRDRQWCPRLFLHANRLAFTHPKSGKRISVEAPLQKELQLVMRRLATGN